MAPTTAPTAAVHVACQAPRVRLVRGRDETCPASTGGDEACPVSTGGGGEASQRPASEEPPGTRPQCGTAALSARGRARGMEGDVGWELGWGLCSHHYIEDQDAVQESVPPGREPHGRHRAAVVERREQALEVRLRLLQLHAALLRQAQRLMSRRGQERSHARGARTGR